MWLNNVFQPFLPIIKEIDIICLFFFNSYFFSDIFRK